MEKTLNELCEEAAQVLPGCFKEWMTPRMYVQCGSGFEPEGLFDSKPEAIPLNCIPGMPKHQTPDQE
ncbi:MAG: hypothetical protein WCT05_15150, partial [Lentisphaeria bacterium]